MATGFDICTPSELQVRNFVLRNLPILQFREHTEHLHRKPWLSSVWTPFDNVVVRIYWIISADAQRTLLPVTEGIGERSFRGHPQYARFYDPRGPAAG